MMMQDDSRRDSQRAGLQEAHDEAVRQALEQMAEF